MNIETSNATPDHALDLAFLQARTFNKFEAKAVSDETLAALYDLCKWGPTAMNTQPMRLVFVKSAEAKEKLLPCLMPGNVDKTRAAPVTAIVAMDTQFYEHLPSQFPANPNAQAMFADNAQMAQANAFRGSSLQGAYLMVAARLLGLAVGAMGGFDAAKVNAAFFPDGRYQANFLVNLGYGDPSGNYPRQARLTFDQVARIV